jgi:hypothetical protein
MYVHMTHDKEGNSKDSVKQCCTRICNLHKVACSLGCHMCTHTPWRRLCGIHKSMTQQHHPCHEQRLSTKAVGIPEGRCPKHELIQQDAEAPPIDRRRVARCVDDLHNQTRQPQVG